MRPGPSQLYPHPSATERPIRLVLPRTSSAGVKSDILPQLPSAYGMLVSGQETAGSVKLVLEFQIPKLILNRLLVLESGER